MFAWICPQCGREVPPSYNECPDCAAKTAVPEAQPVAQVKGSAGAPLPPRPKTAKSKRQLPGWALTVVFALGFMVLGVGGYYASQRLLGKRSAADAGFEEPPLATAASPMAPSVLSKYIEVTGLRLTEGADQKAEIQFVLVNHSGAEVSNLEGTVSLRETVAKPEDPPMGTFSFKVSSIKPYESKDLKVPLQTKLRAYELPDWQFLLADVKITSPPG